jgi:hypothetical protein
MPTRPANRRTKPDSTPHFAHGSAERAPSLPCSGAFRHSPFFVRCLRDLNDSDLLGQGVQIYTHTGGLKLAAGAAMILLAPDGFGAIPFQASSRSESEAGDVNDYPHECVVEPESRGAVALRWCRAPRASRAWRRAICRRVDPGSDRMAPSTYRGRSDPAAARWAKCTRAH